jgi:hypothetical protein
LSSLEAILRAADEVEAHAPLKLRRDPGQVPALRVLAVLVDETGGRGQHANAVAPTDCPEDLLDLCRIHPI